MCWLNLLFSQVEQGRKITNASWQNISTHLKLSGVLSNSHFGSSCLKVCIFNQEAMSCAHWLTNKRWDVYCGAGSAEPRSMCGSCLSKVLESLVRNKNKRKGSKKVADCVRFGAASSFTQKHLSASPIPWTSGQRFKGSNQFCVWVKTLKATLDKN